MYKYQIDNYFEKKIPIISVVYLPLNANGIVDILSINLEYTLKLKKAKNKINEINTNLWEDIKKYTNPYELIYVFNFNYTYNNHNYTHPENEIQSISTIKPLSRSFFKMIEIVYEFIPICFENNIINTLHIAEGPGGFIEAIRFIRTHNNINNNITCKDTAFGITLIDNNHKNVPSWKQSNIFLRNHPEVIISTGYDGSGNIYNIENILFLDKQIKTHCTIEYKDLKNNTFLDTINEHINEHINKIDELNKLNELGKPVDPIKNIENNNKNSNIIDLVTADGGFDYSIEYNYQEQLSSKLIFSQIITALKCQKTGGDFICKFFDLNTYLTIEMLYILYISYDKIIIYKPFTSRIANSEKYIICKGYCGINNIFVNNLIKVLDDWNKQTGIGINGSTWLTGSTVNQLFIEIPLLFIEKIKELNKIIIDSQIESINDIVKIIKTKTNLDKTWKMKNINKNIHNAKEWCKKYSIPYNNT